MKQHITVGQLNELTEEGRKRLRKWCDHKKMSYAVAGRFDEETHRALMIRPLLSIGEMIEFLDLNLFQIELEADMWYLRIFDFSKPSESEEYQKQFMERELCDALWQACVAILNGKEK